MSSQAIFDHFGNLASAGPNSVAASTQIIFWYQGFGSSTYNNDYDYDADPYGVTQYPALGTGWSVTRSWFITRFNYDDSGFPFPSAIVAYFNPPAYSVPVPGPGGYNFAVTGVSGADFKTFSAAPHYEVDTRYFPPSVQWYQNCTLTMTLPAEPAYGFYFGEFEEKWTYLDSGGVERAFLAIYYSRDYLGQPDTNVFNHIGITSGSPGPFIVRTGLVTPTYELTGSDPAETITQNGNEFVFTAPYNGSSRGFDLLLNVAGQTDDPQTGPIVFSDQTLDAVSARKLSANTDAHPFFVIDHTLPFITDLAFYAVRKSQGVYAVHYGASAVGTYVYYLYPASHLDPINRFLSPLKSWSRYYAAPNYPYTAIGNGVLHPEVLSGNYPYINNPQGPLTLIPMNYGLNPDFLIKITVIITPLSGGGKARTRCNLSAPTSHYCRAENAPSSGGIRFWRAFGPVPKLTTPPGGGSPTLWAVNAAPITTNGADTSPSLAADSRGFLYCAFQRVSSPPSSNDGVYFKTSYDGGKTWNTEIMAIPGATVPSIAQGGGSLLIEGVTGSDSAGYQLQTCYKAIGDAVFSAPVVVKDSTGTPLSVDKSGADICRANEGPSRWVLAVLIAGESATSEWWSADGGKSFTRIPTS